MMIQNFNDDRSGLSGQATLDLVPEAIVFTDKMVAMFKTKAIVCSSPILSALLATATSGHIKKTASE